MKAANEARVGIVVVLALILMVVGYFYLRGLGLSSDQYYMRMVGATNIVQGNEVRLQGVKIGQVKDVTLNDEQKPILTVAVKRGNSPLSLLKSYRYSVQSTSLIGENYVDIRGPFVAAAPVYEPNDPQVVIPVTANSPLAGVTDQATQLISDMRGTMSKFTITVDRINKGVLSYQNQLKLARALEGAARLTERAGQSFGPQGVKIGFGDPRAQQSLNDTLRGAAQTAQQANAAAGDLRLLAKDLRGVVGANKAQIGTLLTSLNKTAYEVGGLAQSMSFLVKNGGLKENLNATLVAARKAAENVEAITGNLKSTTGDPNSPNDIKATLASARKAAENVEAATAGLKNLADADTQKNLKDAIASLAATTNSLKDTASAIKTTVTDPETQTQLKTTLATINQASVSLAATSNNLKDASAGFKNVVGDPKFQDDLKTLPAELKSTLAATRGTAQSFQELADRATAFIPNRRKKAQSTNGTPNSTPDKNVKSHADLGAAFPSGVNFTYRNLSNFGGAPRLNRDVSGNNYGDLGLDATLFGAPLRLGVANVGDGTDLTLQTGRYFGNGVALRYGLYRSQLGAGVELRKGRFFAESNAWNLNDHSYNALAGLRITPKIEAFIGRESIRGVRATELGVRLRP